MALDETFSYSVEVQFESSILSKTRLFTAITTLLTIILPFVIAYRSRGFWPISSYFYEQPLVHLTYDYLLIAETDDPSISVICGDAAALDRVVEDENCVQIQTQEDDNNEDGKNDILKIKFTLNIPKYRLYKDISSIYLIFGIDFQIKNVCPLQMQSLAVITKEFTDQPSGFMLYGDLLIHQTKHMECLQNFLDTSLNTSLFNCEKYKTKNVVDFIVEEYWKRVVTTVVNPTYSRTQNGHTGTMELSIVLRISEMEFRYTPSVLQVLKWVLPQYVSLLITFHWLFGRMRKFLFRKRQLMAWEIIPWEKND